MISKAFINHYSSDFMSYNRFNPICELEKAFRISEGLFLWQGKY